MDVCWGSSADGHKPISVACQASFPCGYCLVYKRGPFRKASLLNWLCRWPAFSLCQWSLQWPHQSEAGGTPEEAALEWRFISSIINQGATVSSQPAVCILLVGGLSFQRIPCTYLPAHTYMSCPTTHTSAYNMLLVHATHLLPIYTGNTPTRLFPWSFWGLCLPRSAISYVKDVGRKDLGHC